jgi:hypothetical protein
LVSFLAQGLQVKADVLVGRVDLEDLVQALFGLSEIQGAEPAPEVPDRLLVEDFFGQSLFE